MIPATKLASVWRAAKPRIAAAIAPEASSEVARRLMLPKFDSATATPSRMITAYTSRRTKRRRVSVSGESWPRVTASASASPRRASTRSSRNATISATTIAASAPSQSSVVTSSSASAAAVSSVARSAAGMAGEIRRQAVLLDAMGTLLRFEDPVPRLRAALRERCGAEPGPDAAAAAIRAEIAFYRAHLHEGRDAASLADLRARSAAAMRPALGPACAGVDGATLTAALLDAIAFSAYPDVAPALRALRAGGCALVVVSNWDASLRERLAEAGLAPLIDGAIASAELGAAKPDPAIFARGLALAGVGADRAWHAGDDVAADVEGALAAGIRPVLVHRDGDPPDLPGVPILASLDGLPELVLSGAP